MEAVEIHFDNEALKTTVIDSPMIRKLATRGEIVFPSCKSIKLIVQTKQVILQHASCDLYCLRVFFHASLLSCGSRVSFLLELCVTLIEFHDNNREILMT